VLEKFQAKKEEETTQATQASKAGMNN